VEAVHVHLNPRAHGFGDTVGLPYVFRRRDPALRELGRELGRELEEALRRPGTERWQQTAPILSALTRHLLDRYACPTGDLPVPRLGRERLDDVLAYVHAGLSSRIRVGDLALKAGLSRYHFARAFRERLGLAPSQYVRRARVERAKHLLSCGGESLAGVAHACGFADQSHLTREFRAVVGATPRRFRLAGAGA
jgi:AraC family transcriptional regulator